jgi:protein-L-isoaspartate(D-aspartate) O-methyltransferase
VSEPFRPDRWPPQWHDVTDPLVLAALAAVPRHLFVPPQYRHDAYADIALPIGHNQTISQPYIVALMTQALRLTHESRVLEIGTGSGYQAAILAQITPHVWSVETLPELARTAEERLQGLGYPVAVKIGNGRLGWPEYAPYDAVIITAAASDVPPALIAQLGEGGRLVIPVGATVWEVRFVPLVGSAASAAAEDDMALAAIRRELDELFH